MRYGREGEMIYCDSCNACTDEVMEYAGVVLCLDCYANSQMSEEAQKAMKIASAGGTGAS